MMRMATGWPNSSLPTWIGSNIDSIGPTGMVPVRVAGPVMAGSPLPGRQGDLRPGGAVA